MQLSGAGVANTQPLGRILKGGSLTAAIRLHGALAVFLSLSGCVNFNEVVVGPTPVDSVVLVTDVAVLRDYSLACEAERKREAEYGKLVSDCERRWAEQPPQGIYISSGTKAILEKRQFLQQGKLVDGSPSYDMEKEGAVGLVFIKIKNGPHRDAHGWMPLRFVWFPHTPP